MSNIQFVRMPLVLLILIAAAVTLSPHGLAAKKKQVTYYFTAILAAQAKTQGTVVTGKQTWLCVGNRCTMSRTGPAGRSSAESLSIGMCSNLSNQVGAKVVQFGHQYRVMEPDKLYSCQWRAGYAPPPEK